MEEIKVNNSELADFIFVYEEEFEKNGN